MASSSGLFPSFLLRLAEFRRRTAGRSISVVALCLTLAGSAGAAEMPGYFRQALAQFNPDVPKGWAYTLETDRNGAQLKERYDPSKPPDAQWTLLQLGGRPPSAREIEKYAGSRPGSTSSAPQSTFQKADIEPGSAELIQENADRGEFRCAFRAESTGADKMLGHLLLRFTINRRQPHVEKFSLELREPYSPVLGVKMRELRVQMSLTAPGPGRPGLPVESTSHFLGTIFFISLEENLRITYSDFAGPDQTAGKP